MRRRDRAEAGLSVRPAARADADAIAAIYVQSARHHVALDPTRYLVPDAADVAGWYRRGEQHPPEIAPSDAATLVAEHDGRVVGFVDVRLSPTTDRMHRPDVYCYVSELAVEESARGRGFGAELLRGAEEWGRAHGAVWVYLEYLATNVRAERFYRERMGYKDASRVVMKRLV